MQFGHDARASNAVVFPLVKKNHGGHRDFLSNENGGCIPLSYPLRQKREDHGGHRGSTEVTEFIYPLVVVCNRDGQIKGICNSGGEREFVEL